MKRLKFFILIFCVAVSVPLAYVAWRTYQGLAQEERAQMRFFSETIFDRIEKELAELVQREENRAVDEYHHTLAAEDNDATRPVSPIAGAPGEPYLLGYLQNNPDGSFQTPLVADMGQVSSQQRELVDQLKDINQIFNLKKFAIIQAANLPATPATKPVESKLTAKRQEKDSFADRYLNVSKEKSSKTYLGQKKSRMEEISAQQAINVAKEDEAVLQYESVRKNQAAPSMAAGKATNNEIGDNRSVDLKESQPSRAIKGFVEQSLPAVVFPQKFQVEVAPFQSVIIKDDLVFIFRRIAINNQIYRQGFVLLVRSFLQHLADLHFSGQPLAQFSGLRLRVMQNGNKTDLLQAGRLTGNPDFLSERTFPAPFDFLSASLAAESVPASPARRSLTIALILLGAFMLLGLLAIYQSARTVVDLSERRSQFVSSVTHELKTPLTNIRMYIEMLEQGIAATPEREQDYLRILGSESGRLSRLINNVLELAKLEKKQRHFQLQEGRLEDVLAEVSAVMAPKVTQEEFTLEINAPDVPVFAYDREVLLQILINLIENSIKFGKQAHERRIGINVDKYEDYIRIAVSDTGPGIPRHALKKVFNDFYRVDNDLTRTTGGTGIGLALVKKFMTALGGQVQAANNTGPGCTISLLLPITSQRPA